MKRSYVSALCLHFQCSLPSGSVSSACWIPFKNCYALISLMIGSFNLYMSVNFTMPAFSKYLLMSYGILGWYFFYSTLTTFLHCSQQEVICNCQSQQFLWMQYVIVLCCCSGFFSKPWFQWVWWWHTLLSHPFACVLGLVSHNCHLYWKILCHYFFLYSFGLLSCKSSTNLFSPSSSWWWF